ncbi:MAG TPA: hypothetical protein VMV47_14250 [Bacteroidales bacterium]|nr:hypothetical protein [Bacteroidales bacterium]
MKNTGKRILRLSALWSIMILVNNYCYKSSDLSASPYYQSKYQFVKPPLTFDKFKGLEFRLSEPFLSGNDPGFTIALELKNKTADDLTRLTFRVKLFDKQGKVVSESMNNCGPLTFLPASGKTIPPGYTGVYERFSTRDKNFMETFGKIEIELIEIETAPKGMYDKPVFDPDWQTFEAFKGLEFRLSKPFKYLDDLSGNTYFAIAIEFKNRSRKAIKFLNFSQKVYDDQGLLVDREVQNHNQMYEPYEIRDEKFPAAYSGINKKFYINDLKFFEKFQKIEYTLVSVEY